MLMGWSVRFTTKHGNSLVLHSTKLDATINQGCRSWCSIKRTLFSLVLHLIICALYGGIITGIFF